MADKLNEMVKKEFDTLTAEKNELLKQVAEVDKKLAPILAYMNAGKKKEGAKRGRKPKEVAAAKQ